MYRKDAVSKRWQQNIKMKGKLKTSEFELMGWYLINYGESDETI